jgi:hypothetical protein
MTDTTGRPWWASFIAELIPDIRAWATAAMFVLVFYMLHLIATHPEMASNELFKTVATLLIGSGAFGLVCAFLWGGSKGSASAIDTVNAMARSSPGPSTPPGGTATVTAAPDVDITVRDAKP